jgi:IS30 family transposase
MPKEQISGWMKKHRWPSVSHEWIYQPICADHQTISKYLSLDFYFAHPYASWERGTNENTNGLIRQYLPKERDLTTVTAEEEIMIMDRLNLHPRKCPDFRTSYEVFFGRPSVALTS